MDIRPILSTLRRHQTAAALIVIEIALTCAILCNALDLIGQRITRLQRSTGWAEAELVVIGITGIGKEANADALTRQDLAALRALPGVRQATIINQVPYGGSSWNTGVQLAPDQGRSTMTVSQYLVSEHFIDTMGLRLIAGRDFLPDEYSYESAANNDSIRSLSVIVSRAMGERLFPKGDVLGKTIYMRDMPAKIVGIVDTLTSTRDLRPDRAEMAMAMPLRVAYSRGGQYVLRTDPTQRNAVLKAAVAELQKINPNRVVLTQRTFEEMKSKFFAPDRAMAGLLAAVCIALLVVTALGIVGLASFWVQQRTRMIGTRRALGATRGQILRYFQTENFLLASAGIVLGMAGAYGINQVLMTQYELARLPAFYLPVGAVALWALGQLAVLAPARRAATLPPVAALRA
jgi:putative ABC transport system permease protein